MQSDGLDFMLRRAELVLTRVTAARRRAAPMPAGLACLALFLLPARALGGALAEEVGAMTPGIWYEIPDSSITGVLVRKDEPRIQGDPRNVIDVWCGSAFDSLSTTVASSNGARRIRLLCAFLALLAYATMAELAVAAG